MRDLKIEKGKKESSPLTLAHWKIDTVFSPGVEEQFGVEILGSHDGKEFGSINGATKFFTNTHYSVATFDSDMFAGIQFVKFVLDKPAPQDLVFYINIKDT